MAHDDFHEFIGAIVTQIMFQMLAMAEIQRFTIVQGRHDIPGYAPMRHEICGREKPCDVIGFVIGS